MKKVLLVLFLAQAIAIGVALFTQRARASEVRFWSPSCAACMEEMPKMLETYRRSSEFTAERACRSGSRGRIRKRYVGEPDWSELLERL